MIAVVSTSYREADILDKWILHLLAEEVDLILVADKLAPDGTRERLMHWGRETSGRVIWFNDEEPYHLQAHWTDRLAAAAHDRGADFIIPADIDEFPYSVTGETLGSVLKDCPYDHLKIWVWPHLDWNNRFEKHHQLPKVAYRWSSDARVTMGSHAVSLPAGEYDILHMRELKYRSFEHFCQKVTDRNTTLEPAARSRGDGAHHLWLENQPTELLRAEWEKMQAQPTVVDPIPGR